MLGWNSAQFTQMPTGAGGGKYCNYPEYDFEIVYISDKKTVCSTDMVMLDPISDFDNYVNYGYISGTADNLNVSGLDASVMKLSERNVPSSWTGLFPNSIAYGNPEDYKYYTDISKCPYTDQVYDKYTGQPPNTPYKS